MMLPVVSISEIETLKQRTKMQGRSVTGWFDFVFQVRYIPKRINGC